MLIVALKKISDETIVPAYRAKGTGLLKRMESFNFIFAMCIMEPILQTILKVSTSLQEPNLLDLLTDVQLIN